MNIKNILGNHAITPTKMVDRTDRLIKSDMTHDRDGNGQQTFNQNQKQQEPMTETQLQQALDHLKNLSFVKENNWVIELFIEEKKRTVVVKDNLGNIIRTFPEADLWTLPIDLEDKKGQFLKKTA